MVDNGKNSNYQLTQNGLKKKALRIAYIGRSLLDYRVPVFDALNRMSNGGLHVIYSKNVTPERVQKKILEILGNQAVGLEGEKRFGPEVVTGFANTTFRACYQPGALKALKRIEPEVLVADGFFQWTAFALAYRMLYGVPLVICYERTNHTERNAQWYRRLYRRMVVGLVGAMSCNGKLSLEYSKSLKIDYKRINTGHMVADTENLKKQVAGVSETRRQELRSCWGNPQIVFLSVGQLIKRKGFHQLINGWSRFSRAYDGNTVLVILGSGPEHTGLRELIERLKLKSVYLPGEVDYDQIATYYVSADIFIIPTLEDNWSLVVPEAMACGLPVICSIYNGCWPEYVKEGLNGWVFDPLDETSTVRVLEKVSDERVDLKKMGVESQRIISNFTPEHGAKAILNACLMALHA